MCIRSPFFLSSVVLTLSLLVGGAATPAHAADGKKVAVKALDATSVPSETAAMLTSLLCTELSKQKMNVLCADDVAALLKHAAIQQTLAACEGDDCLMALGNAAKADYVVSGNVGKLDDTYVMTVQLLDIKSSKVLARTSEKVVAKASGLIDKMPAIAQKLKP